MIGLKTCNGKRQAKMPQIKICTGRCPSVRAGLQKTGRNSSNAENAASGNRGMDLPGSTTTKAGANWNLNAGIVVANTCEITCMLERMVLNLPRSPQGSSG